MITIDGSQGEGGGQILRTALALSLVTGRAFRIENIRAGRKKPGLLRQHLTAVEAATRIGDAGTDGAEIGSQKAREMTMEAFEEHHVVDLVLAELPKVDPEDERFEAKMTVLMELVEHHVEEEEEEMFKLAQKLGNDELKALGERMEEMAGRVGQRRQAA